MEELLQKILSKVEALEENSRAIKTIVMRMESKLDATFEQVVKNSEADTAIKTDLNTFEHGLNILNKKQFVLETELEKLKNR